MCNCFDFLKKFNYIGVRFVIFGAIKHSKKNSYSQALMFKTRLPF